ncbi:3901_t:CDS:2 [Cetraspora pellucida]|uniref:3901_t:CDS:1 n=1 Tax=Cetraspora pellucida TaxID=1433469 RepID=A0ACA9KGQ3_9GLOM|nr:3901_t:CDS:2 [Cetraspora pellucida]
MEHEMKPNEQDQTTNQKTDDSLKKKQAEKFNVPSKKWNKMLEKAQSNQYSLLYVFVAVLAVMFVWLKFLGWSENWKLWEWFGDHMKDEELNSLRRCVLYVYGGVTFAACFGSIICAIT